MCHHACKEAWTDIPHHKCHVQSGRQYNDRFTGIAGNNADDRVSMPGVRELRRVPRHMTPIRGTSIVTSIQPLLHSPWPVTDRHPLAPAAHTAAYAQTSAMHAATASADMHAWSPVGHASRGGFPAATQSPQIAKEHSMAPCPLKIISEACIGLIR